MPYILVDSCVFTRLEGKYRSLLECIERTTDVLGYTGDILKEYEGNARPNLTILRAFIQSLGNKGKIKYFNKKSVDSAVRRYSRRRRINYPTHIPDKKWTDTAIAIKARFIISTDGHLLRACQNQCNGETTESLEPAEYVSVRCPDLN